jgi:L-amino acid N-acyltransferase YncA
LVKIRPAIENDISAITDIYAYHVRHGAASFEIDPPDTPEMKQRWLKLAEKNFPYFVAEEAGKVIGYAYAGPYRERLAYRYTAEDSVYVDQRHTGKGVGRLLLSEIIRHSQNLGIKQMIAAIGDSNNAASIGLHTRCGFYDVGILKNAGFKFERWLDVVFMQRAL